MMNILLLDQCFGGCLGVMVVLCFCFINLFTVKYFNFTSHKEKGLHSSLYLTTIICSYCENNSISESADCGIHNSLLVAGTLKFPICSAGTPFLRCMLETKSPTF